MNARWSTPIAFRATAVAALSLAVLAGPARVALAQESPSCADPFAAKSHDWGRIANRQHQGDRPISALFFAGPPNPGSLGLYTRHPLHADRLEGTDAADVHFALRQMGEVGLNTIKLSYWGHNGETDSWAPSLLFSRGRWPGDTTPGNYQDAQQLRLGRRFFLQAAEHGMLISPMIEVSPAFGFWWEFPFQMGNMINRANWLLTNFGDQPNWLEMYDQNGTPRRVIWLIESINVTGVDPETFAAGFDAAAQQIEDATGYKVGFVIDPTPLPAYGTHSGPDPVALKRHPAVLAINPFNICSQGPGDVYKPQGQITEAERQAYAESILSKWSASGLPVIAPIMPGYDAHIVFADSTAFGFNAAWRAKQKDLAVKYETGGLSIDCWNGWTEGYAIPPTVEDGNVNMRWAQSTVDALRMKWRKK